jgi:hypothetical protein
VPVPKIRRNIAMLSPRRFVPLRKTIADLIADLAAQCE